MFFWQVKSFERESRLYNLFDWLVKFIIFSHNLAWGWIEIVEETFLNGRTMCKQSVREVLLYSITKNMSRWMPKCILVEGMRAYFTVFTQWGIHVSKSPITVMSFDLCKHWFFLTAKYLTWSRWSIIHRNFVSIYNWAWFWKSSCCLKLLEYFQASFLKCL